MEMLSGYLEASDERQDDCGDLEALNRGPLEGMPDELSPEEVQAASASFATATTYSYDGFHPRHFRLLGRPGLRTLARLS